MMKVLLLVVCLLVCQIVSLSGSKTLLTVDEVAHILSRYGKGQLRSDENEVLQDILQILRQPEYYSAQLLENSPLAARRIQCLVCNSAFRVVIDDVRNGASDTQIAATLTTLCYSLGIESYKVCRGAVGLNVPILTYIMKNTPEAAPQTFCSLLLQTAQNNVCPMTDTRFEWQVDLPDPPASPPVFQDNDDTNPLTVAVLTDAHIDPLYEANGVGNCDEPTCCRKGQKQAKLLSTAIKINDKVYQDAVLIDGSEMLLNLTSADIIRRAKATTKPVYTRRDTAPAGYWGDYRKCDTPMWAYDDLVQRIKEQHKKVDIIYYIGDSIDHGVWETTYDLINKMNNYTIMKIRQEFGDDVLVVPTIGNHETQPTNQFAPSRITEDKLNTTWLYKALANKWDHYLTDDAKASLMERGDFSILYKPGFRIISLNNNVAYRDNWWLVYDPTDCKRHLDWLVQELYAAEQAGERVHILTHIPPGVHDLQYTWTREYNRIVNRFSSIIMAEFNGHTHADEFKVFYNLTDPTQAINVAWNGGGATAYSNYNLNYKILTLDPQTYAPQKIENYVYNLTEANLHPNRRPHWFLLYDFKNSFNLEDFSAPSISDLVNRMVTTDKSLLTLYSAYFSKLSDPRLNCNTECMLDALCKTVVTVLWDRNKCNELRALFLQ